MKIRSRLSLASLCVAMFAALGGYYGISLSKTALEQSLEKHTGDWASRILSESDRSIYTRIEQLRAYADRLAEDSTLGQSNQQFGALDDVQAYIEEKDRAWRAADEDVTSPFMANLIHNKMSVHLRRDLAQKSFYQRTQHHEVFSEVFITNKYGANVAQTNKTTDYFQADEAWWQRARRDGLYVGPVGYDESAGVYSTDICVSIEDREGAFLGVIKSVVNLDEVLQPIREQEKHHPVKFKLLTSDNRVIYATSGYDTSTPLQGDRTVGLRRRIVTGGSGYMLAKDTNENSEESSLYAAARSQGYRDYGGLGWVLVVELNRQKLLSQIRMLWNRSLGILLIATLFAICCGALIARSICNPLKKLIQAATSLGEGDLSMRVPRKAPGEVGELNCAFNRMTSQLQISTMTLEREVSEHQRAKEALDESEKKYQGIFEESVAAIFLFDTKTRFTGANQAGLDLLGYSRDELYRLRIPDVAADVTTVLPAHRQLQAGQRLVNYEHQLKRKDGRIITVLNNSRLLTDDHGQIVGKQSTLIDITDRKQAEASLASQVEENRQNALALEESHRKAVGVMKDAQRSRRIAERISEHLRGVAVTVRGLMVAATESGQFGARFDPSSRQRCWELNGCQRLDCPGRSVRLHERCWETMGSFSDGEVRRHCARLTKDCKQCEVYQHNIHLASLNDLGETFNQMMAALEDRQRALESALSSAEDATRSKSEFLANMSHEIRTPMTAILGFTENLLDPDLSEGERSQAIHIIRGNGEHLLAIINDILDISKIEAGKVEIERIPCSIFGVVHETKMLMQVRADAKKIPLNIEYIGAIPETIESDPTRLKQILVNLVGNAIKFTEAGEIKLVARSVTDGPVPMIQFDVLDTGIGMTPEQLGKLFQAFSQADSATTRKFGGSGLGLNISKCLAGMLGGDITVKSKPGVGSSFRVTVTAGSIEGVKMVHDPSSTFSSLSTDSKPTEAEVPTLDCRILLAEDNLTNQILITGILRKANAEIVVAGNGQLALDAVLAARDEGNPFDVVLMDMQMPVMDGYEATAMLRQRGYTGPIIALTAHSMASEQQKCIDVGCDEYASKPINRKKLLASIKAYLAVGAGA